MVATAWRQMIKLQSRGSALDGVVGVRTKNSWKIMDGWAFEKAGVLGWLEDDGGCNLARVIMICFVGHNEHVGIVHSALHVFACGAPSHAATLVITPSKSNFKTPDTFQKNLIICYWDSSNLQLNKWHITTIDTWDEENPWWASVHIFSTNNRRPEYQPTSSWLPAL